MPTVVPHAPERAGASLVRPSVFSAVSVCGLTGPGAGGSKPKYSTRGRNQLAEGKPRIPDAVARSGEGRLRFQGRTSQGRIAAGANPAAEFSRCRFARTIRPTRPGWS